MLTDLFTVDQLFEYDRMRQASSLPDGYITTIFGLTVVSRTDVVLYNNVTQGVKKAVGAASAATDCYGAIAWQMDEVAKAMGEIMIYDEVDSPLYYGSILSTEVLFGGSRLRTSEAGVISIAQGYTAP
jgi:hypothetical protein